ncbi:protein DETOXIFICATION 45, chloroplastic isoform X2 [Lotus japonicus]|uniref:protein DETOXIFICATION 45, chloroplastic isoform X2 n=1 Tax=Lotus japonicus TaxID=34305 RepID=UPI002587FED7|nr:protein DETOXIFICATION 45, chloroplastic isoform X2 [Lotus japonicus]
MTSTSTTATAECPCFNRQTHNLCNHRRKPSSLTLLYALRHRERDSHLSTTLTLRAKPLSVPCFSSPRVDGPLHQQHSLLTDDSDSDKDHPTVPTHTHDQLGINPNQEKIDVKRELLMLSLPALAGQAIDPLAQLMETAYIGRLGTLELASAGVSITIFNIVSKLFNIPLLSVATSFVAEDLAANLSASDHTALQNDGNGKPLERKQLSSVSTALLLALGLGIFESLALYLGSGTFLHIIGVSAANPTRVLAQKFLSLRAVGAPAVVLSLALQGIFRGFKDTKTPVLCLGIGNLSAVFLFPLLMYYFQLGVTGAAISTVLSQYIGALLMIWNLNNRAVLLPPKLGSLQFGSYIKSGGFLLGRTLAVLTTMTLGTSMAARHGPVAMAAHQICMQVWLAVSLLTDALAASGQALVASSLSRHEYKAVKELTNFVLKIGLLTGICLTAILGVSFGSLAGVFTQDLKVLQVARTGVLFVSASQPFNALAYIFDGLHFGVSDFRYAAFSMMFVGAVSSAFLVFSPSRFGLHGVWLGLSLFMALRVVAGSVRLLSKNGPWWFLHRDYQIAEMVS